MLMSSLCLYAWCNKETECLLVPFKFSNEYWVVLIFNWKLQIWLELLESRVVYILQRNKNRKKNWWFWLGILEFLVFKGHTNLRISLKCRFCFYNSLEHRCISEKLPGCWWVVVLGSTLISYCKDNCYTFSILNLHLSINTLKYMF